MTNATKIVSETENFFEMFFELPPCAQAPICTAHGGPCQASSGCAASGRSACWTRWCILCGQNSPRWPEDDPCTAGCAATSDLQAKEKPLESRGLVAVALQRACPLIATMFSIGTNQQGVSAVEGLTFEGAMIFNAKISSRAIGLPFLVQRVFAFLPPL